MEQRYHAVLEVIDSLESLTAEGLPRRSHGLEPRNQPWVGGRRLANAPANSGVLESLGDYGLLPGPTKLRTMRTRGVPGTAGLYPTGIPV